LKFDNKSIIVGFLRLKFWDFIWERNKKGGNVYFLFFNFILFYKNNVVIGKG
jgi:hypothetical protein